MEEKKEVTFGKLKSESKSHGSSKGSKEACLFNISMEGYSKMLEVGLDMNSLYVLHICLKGGLFDQDLVRLNSWKQKLIRKQLITDEFKPTLTGKEIYEAISGNSGEERKRVLQEDNFEIWWKNYPGTDDFEYKGIKFKGGRSLRTNKKACKIKFETILNEGEISVEEIVNALNMEVEMKMQQSFDTRTNKLTYMQNSLTWLNQRTFEPFVEKLRTKQPTKNTSGPANTMLI